MSIYEEHKAQFEFEQAQEEAEHKLHANINASFTKVLAKALLEMKYKNK